MNNFLQEPFADRDLLEDHASKIHQINREGLQKLASLVEGCHWLNKTRTDNQQLKTPSKETEENCYLTILDTLRKKNRGGAL